jgi:hypothetical protein
MKQTLQPPGKKGFDLNESGPARGYAGGNEKNRSHSQMSIQHTNNKTKLVDFALLRLACSSHLKSQPTSTKLFSINMNMYLMVLYGIWTI